MQWKYESFIAIECFVFLVDAFQFSKFHASVAKHDKLNFERDLIVTFMVKRS